MNSTYELIRATAERVPERSALEFLPQATPSAPVIPVSYRQLLQRITQFANWLHARGLAGDDAVSIVLPILPQFHFAFWGAQAAAVGNPINPWLEAEHMASIMKRARTTVLVTLAPEGSAELWAKVEAIARDVPTLRHVLTVDPASAAGRAAAQPQASRIAGVSIQDFDAAIAAQPGDRLLSDRRFSAGDIAAYFHTGGTTGHPKLARLTHGNQVSIVRSLATAFDLHGGRFACGMPLFHITGITVLGLLPLSIGGSVLLLTPAGFRGAGVFANFWKLVERFRIENMAGVPTIYTGLLEAPIGDADISSLNVAICGGSPLSDELERRFEATTGKRLLQGYGLTETVSACTANPIHGDRPTGSIGKALPDVEMKVVELDRDGRWLSDCPDDVAGEIVVRGPNVFVDYLDEPEANEGSMLPGGWLRTGDLGRRDGNGFFWLTGRAKDLIIRGGHNIDPGIIEEPLLRHPAVAVVAAVGRPDAYAGEVPVAYVQLRPGRSVRDDELQRYAAEHIQEKAAVPKAIYVVEQLPLTAIGKPFKPALVWRETEQVFSAALADVSELTRFHVAVGADARRGTLARVSIQPARGCTAKAARAAANAALGSYATRFEITVEPAA